MVEYDTESDSLAQFKTYFHGGDGSLEKPFEVRGGILIDDVLRNAAVLTIYAQDHTIHFVWNGDTIALDNKLHVMAADPNKVKWVPMIEKSIQTLIEKEHLDKTVQPMSPAELEAFQQKLRAVQSNPIDIAINRGIGAFQKLTARVAHKK